MIEIKITGNDMSEVTTGLAGLARYLSVGAQVLAQRPADAPIETPLAEPVPAGEEKPAPKAKPKKVEKTPDPQPISAESIVENVEQAQSTDVRDEDIAAEIDVEVPKDVDGLRKLAMKRTDEVGYALVQAEIAKFAPKLSEIKVEDYKKFVTALAGLKAKQ